MWVLLLQLGEPEAAWARSALPRDGNPDWLWGIKTCRRICHPFSSDRENSKLLAPCCVGKFHSSECFYPAHSQGCAASHDFSDAYVVGEVFCNQSGLHSKSRLVWALRSSKKMGYHHCLPAKKERKRYGLAERAPVLSSLISEMLSCGGRLSRG